MRLTLTNVLFRVYDICMLIKYMVCGQTIRGSEICVLDPPDWVEHMYAVSWLHHAEWGGGMWCIRFGNIGGIRGAMLVFA